MKTIFFDLDGTLLSMDLMEFVENYYRLLAGYVARMGYEPKAFVRALNEGVKRMMANDGSATNEDIFWQAIAGEFGEQALESREALENFYHNDFQKMAELIEPKQELLDLIESLKGKANLVLATNPLFPKLATQYRMKFAGLNPEDFSRVTTYEDAFYSKPSPKYYQALLEELGLQPDEIVMIGNDAIEDGAASVLGVPVFLLEDHLLNGEDSRFETKRGNLDDLKEFIEEFINE